MFIPTNSDGQKLVNLRKELKEKKIFFSSDIFFKISTPPSASLLFLPLVFFFKWDPHVPLFHFLVRFSPETIYFVPVSISFILIEYS